MSDEKLLAVAKVNNPVAIGPFNKKEQLVIELADEMANTPANIANEFYQRLRDEFSEEQLMELSAHIAFENYRARWNRVFDIGSDELYKPKAESKLG